MRSPARAIAWEFRRRHRWGLIAVAGYLLVLGAIKLLILESGQPVNPARSLTFAFTVIVPLTSAFFFFVAMFSFGFAGDLAGRQSLYPARMFTLPVTTAALAGWPMLYGTAAAAGLWLVAARVALWPSGIDVPLIWPMLFAAVFLAWTQVLTWMPYGLRGLRAIAAVLWLATIDAVVFSAIHYKVPEALMVAIFAPQLPLAYICARFAVAMARRGDVPDWRGAFAALGQIAEVLPRWRAQFPSAARAQLWFEWRRHGLSLPVWVAILLPFELALLFLVRDTPALVFETLAGVLLTPPFMAAFTAATMRKSGADGGDAYGVTPFMATRPVTSAALAAAKLTMTIASTCAAWLLVVVALPPALILSGTWPLVGERARQAIEVLGAPRSLAIVLLGFSGLLASTWKQLVQAECIGLTGRAWLVKSSVFLRLSLLIVIVPLAQWIVEKRDVTLLWDAFPWILAGLVCFKMSAAASIATRLFRARLLDDRALVLGAACWLAAVLALYGLLVWLVSTPPLIPRYFPALVAILAIPLARPSAAPLALAWNRHRGSRPTSETATNGRRRVAGAVLALVGAPVALALTEAASFHVLNRNSGAIVSSGQEREYVLYVPRSYDRARPTPLVISLHGAAGWPVNQQETSQWNAVAENDGFIVVYPSGVSRRGPRIWRLEDVRFISDVIDTLTAAYNIDATRIYADGLSNGGGMAFALSCTLSDRIAAVGMVASAQLLPWSWCTDRRPVPMIAFHGTADRVVPYHGGLSWMAPNPFPDIPTWAANWAQRNRCAPTAIDAAVATDVIRRSYSNCADAADVVLYTIEGGGHTWPGGKPMPSWLVGSSSDSIDATRQIWTFFREHPLLP